MYLRRSRILSTVLIASLAIAVSDGLLCLLPCASAVAPAADGRPSGDTLQPGHCVTADESPTPPGPSVQQGRACAAPHGVGEWVVVERATSRAYMDRAPADAVVALLHMPAHRPALVTVRHSTTSASPPGAVVPLRI